MSFFDKIFGGGQPMQEDVIVIPSIMPMAAIVSIQNGKLTSLSTQNLLLKQNEKCYFCERGINLIQKNMVTGYKRKDDGFSIRIFSGLTYHTGNKNTDVKRNDITFFTKGTLYITNERIVFVAKKDGIHKKLSDLIAMDCTENSVIIQFEKKSYEIMLPDSAICYKVLQLTT